MAAVIISSQLAEGATGEWIWHNPPTGVAHAFTAEPFCPFDYSGLHSTFAAVKITDIIDEQQFVTGIRRLRARSPALPSSITASGSK